MLKQKTTFVDINFQFFKNNQNKFKNEKYL